MRARRLVPVVCAALVVAIGLQGSASAKSSLKVGFLDNTYVTTHADVFFGSQLNELNVGIMRWDVQWKSIAPTRPVTPRDPADPTYQWAQTDAFVRNAATHGLQDRVIFTLWRTPSWAAEVPREPLEAQMPRVADWRDFVAATATRYSGSYVPPGESSPLPRVAIWETWNEPNSPYALLPQRQSGRYVGPANYVVLLHTLEAEVDAAVDFRPTFLAGALYKQKEPGALKPLEFLRGMRRIGARFDALSIHPYNTKPARGLNDGMQFSKTNPRAVSIGNMAAFIRQTNRIFGRKYPVYVTEFGWGTPAVGKDRRVVSTEQQARFLSGAITRFRKLPQVEAMIWFLVEDNPLRPNGPWYTTGLRTSDGTPKPAWQSWVNTAATLEPGR